MSAGDRDQVCRFPLLSTWQAMLLPILPPLGGELLAGSDGMLHSTRKHGDQFHPWATIRGCSVSGAEVTTLHDDGFIIRWHLTGAEDATRLATIVDQGITGDRGTSFEMRWPGDLQDAVRKLVEAGAPSPEDGLVLDERLQLIECPHAPVMSRACAALQVAWDHNARERIRRVAMSCAHPGSRDLFLAIADLDLERLSHQAGMWFEGAPESEPRRDLYDPRARLFVSSPAEQAWNDLVRHAWLVVAALSVAVFPTNASRASVLAMLTPIAAVLGPIPWHSSQQHCAPRLRAGRVLVGDEGVSLDGKLLIPRSAIGQGFVRTLGSWYFVRFERSPGHVLADVRFESLEEASEALASLGIGAGQRPASFHAMHPDLARWYGSLLPLLIGAAVVSLAGAIHAPFARAGIALSLGLSLLAKVVLSHRTVTVHPDAVEFRWGLSHKRVAFSALERLERTANGGTLVTSDGTRHKLRGVPNDPPDRRPSRGDALVDRVSDALDALRTR